MPKVAERRARDKRRTAFHEAGHTIIAWHFRMPATAYLAPNKEKRGPGAVENKYYKGQTQFHFSTRFRSCVIGWGGPLAEELAVQSFEEWNVRLDDLYDCTTGIDGESNSETDMKNIYGHPQNRAVLAGLLLRATQ